MSNVSGTPQYVSDQIGSDQDRVAVRLGGDDVLYAESWNVEESILSQPARWSVRMGFAEPATVYYEMYYPGTIFQLSIRDAIQARGRVDRRQLEQSGSGNTLVLSGRDALAPLQDGFVQAAQSFANPNQTYADLVWRALGYVGIVPFGSKLDPTVLVSSNLANRQLRAGVPVTELKPPTQDLTPDDQQITGTIGAVTAELQAKIGERWLHFVRRVLDRAGLMLWAGADGTFILSAPNPNQKPTYRLHRTVGQPVNESNIKAWSVVDDTTGRHSEVVVYGRGGGRKFGAQKAKGNFVDQEMLDLGFDRPLVFKDAEVQTGNQAAYFARRKIAEERREGHVIEYTIAGHTLPSADGQSRAVITPDTTIDVQDELLNISGTFYIEAVRRTAPPTETRIRLMRPQDLVFGDISATAAAGAQQPKSSGLTSVNIVPEIHGLTTPWLQAQANQMGITTPVGVINGIPGGLVPGGAERDAERERAEAGGDGVSEASGGGSVGGK